LLTFDFAHSRQIRYNIVWLHRLEERFAFPSVLVTMWEEEIYIPNKIWQTKRKEMEYMSVDYKLITIF
jgi:hypothetical protein